MDNDFVILESKLSGFCASRLIELLDEYFDYLVKNGRFSDSQLIDFALLSKLDGKFRSFISDCPKCK